MLSKAFIYACFRVPLTYRWLSGRLQYLQCVSDGCSLALSPLYILYFRRETIQCFELVNFMEAFKTSVCKRWQIIDNWEPHMPRGLRILVNHWFIKLIQQSLNYTCFNQSQANFFKSSFEGNLTNLVYISLKFRVKQTDDKSYIILGNCSSAPSHCVIEWLQKGLTAYYTTRNWYVSMRYPRTH